MKRLAPILLCFALLLMLSSTGTAASVTDTLTVKVGYYGMAAEEYVEVATYHWSELSGSLPLYQQAYSFYRDSGDGEFRVAIDSALGFGIMDLADFAGIYSGDVSAVLFYTKDQEVGSFTTFSAAELFSTRWYFDDLAANLTPCYNEEGVFQGYDDTQAWQHATQVQPMLALEDSWVWYDIGTEHTAPNYASLGTGNRFRLLFGQNNPTECRTNQTAKYTHSVLFTLSGAPAYAGQLPELSSTIGSHTVQFTVSIDNASLRDAAASLLKFSSSNEQTMQITGWTAAADDTYADLVTITLRYDVLAEGSASLQMGYGGTQSQSGPEIVVSDESPSPSEDPNVGGTPNSSEAADRTGNEQTQPSGGSGEEAQSEAPTENNVPTEQIDTPVSHETQRVLLMSDRLVQQLNKQNSKPPAEQTESNRVSREELLVSPKEPAPVLQTIIGTAALLLSGALGCAVYYRKERKSK